MSVTDDTLVAALREVEDPETGLNIVDLGLVYETVLAPDGEARVLMTFTTPFCPAGDVLLEGVERRLGRVPGVAAVSVEVTFEPPWTPERISAAGRSFLEG